MIAIIFYLLAYRKKLEDKKLSKEAREVIEKMKNKKKGKGQVDKKFFKRVLKLIKIVVPGWTSGPAVNLYLLSIALLLRTYLTIQLAAINGGIVKTIVNRDYSDFVRRCIFLLFFSIPASTVNSALTYFNKKLAI